MINEKTIKGRLKKCTTITQGILVLFLITGGLNPSFGNGISINNDKTIMQQIEIRTETNIFNNGIIKPSDLSEDRINSGNGLSRFQLSSNPGIAVTLKQVINNGLIEGDKSFKNEKEKQILNTGNALSIYNQDSGNQFLQNILKVENNGQMNGKVHIEDYLVVDNKSLYGSGNGISNYNNTSKKGISSIGEIVNVGDITGDGSILQLDNTTSNKVSATAVGNGISNLSHKSTIEKINNKGNIIGNAFIGNNSGEINSAITSFGIGNGILNYSLENGDGIINSLINNGIIKGIVETKGKQLKLIGSGNGVSSFFSNLGNVENKGLIIGDIKNQISPTKLDINNSGNGIAFNKSGTIENSGVIRGKEYSINGNSGEVKNYGTLIGKQIVSKSLLEENLGIHIELVELPNGNTAINKIINGKGGEVRLSDGTIKTILNGTTNGDISTIEGTLDKNDSFINASKLTTTENLIINGAGISHGSLTVDINDFELKNSIINASQAAITLEKDGKTTLTDVVINSSKTDLNAISGFNTNNELNIKNNSIINGNINLGAGTDTLSISNTVQINGNLDGGNDLDILNLGEKTTSKVASNLNIFHEINNFENISTNGDITLFEVAKVTGADEINLESGNLILRVDPTITLDGKVTGHALYGNNGTLSSTGGNLVIGLNGIGANTTVSMGGTTITSGTNDSWWKDTDHIKTNSLVLDGKLSDDGKDVNITIKEFIPLEPPKPIPPIDPPIDPPVDPPVNPPVEPPTVIDSLLYEKLNKVYQSTVTAGEIGALANTTLLEDKTYEESLGGLLTILDQIYANNPYAYTLKSSRDSLKLFEDNMSYLTIKPKENEWIIQGKGIYTGVKNDNASSGKNYYGFDTGHRNYKTTTSTSGGLATFEYGLSDKTSIGGVIGGNNQDINFKGSSKIKGNSLYLGTFAKTDINNFKLMAGLGYQYTAADADRSVSNMYDSFKTSDKYDINSLNAFAEVKYSIEGNDNWTLEPKARLSYYYIEQDNVNEGYTPGQLSVGVDKANSNTADLELGIDLIKNVYLQQGKLKNIFSFGIINTIGDKSKELNGYVLGNSKDGNKFDIQGVELPRTSGKVAYNLELEQTSGMIYTAGVSMEFAKDYNRNASATIGLGYKF
ncbi:autotransporter outer membrane beta-barrel domain-containing protein [Cetobacterium sp. 2A]|uniref:autotransporter family protein n=1 Tax=Cetobacterium sp. 2A TaxID=2754723 RepID=UPI00163C342F|nr:autotransporter outer membrane beta-barrel domain-containing protein [Cetobacterium sp. 2A]MBC2856950.1 autotransporter outer membrane beta-barrel domain-containing protein [Cetobacterium sp. 2A]